MQSTGAERDGRRAEAAVRVRWRLRPYPSAGAGMIGRGTVPRPGLTMRREGALEVQSVAGYPDASGWRRQRKWWESEDNRGRGKRGSSRKASKEGLAKGAAMDEGRTVDCGGWRVARRECPVDELGGKPASRRLGSSLGGSLLCRPKVQSDRDASSPLTLNSSRKDALSLPQQSQKHHQRHICRRGRRTHMKSIRPFPFPWARCMQAVEPA